MLWAMDWGLPSKAPNVLSCIKNITFKSREDWNQNILSDKSVWPYSQPILDPVASGEAVLLSNLLNFRFVRKREWRPGEGKLKNSDPVWGNAFYFFYVEVKAKSIQS